MSEAAQGVYTAPGCSMTPTATWHAPIAAITCAGAAFVCAVTLNQDIMKLVPAHGSILLSACLALANRSFATSLVAYIALDGLFESCAFVAMPPAYSAAWLEEFLRGTPPPILVGVPCAFRSVQLLRRQAIVMPSSYQLSPPSCAVMGSFPPAPWPMSMVPASDCGSQNSRTAA